MTDKGLYISSSLAIFQKETGTGLLSFLNNSADGWKAGEGSSLLAIKRNKDKSLREMLDTSDWESEYKAESLLRDKLVYWDQFKKHNLVANHNPMFKRLADAFEDKSFTGALVFDLAVIDFPKKDICGNSHLLAQANFCAPFFQIQIPRDSETWQMDKASVWGFLSLCNSVVLPFEKSTQTGFSLDRTDVLLEAGKISCSGAVCRVLVPNLFSSEISGDRYLTLYGAYELAGDSVGQGTNRYYFILLSYANVYPTYSAASLIHLESLESAISTNQDEFSLQLYCSGRLYFKTASSKFDPFSYGYETSGTITKPSVAAAAQQEGLPFRGLTFSYNIAGGKVKNSSVSYRTLVVEAEKAVSRSKSFARAFSDKDAGFLCWETSSSPENLGYLQIEVPCKQSTLQQYWYGLCFQVAMTKNVNLKFLFAWSVDGNEVGFYSGALVEAFGSPKKLKITVGSLFHLGFQSIMVQSDTQYSILLKGLSVGMLGLSMPQNACDITLLSKEDENNQTCKAWVSVYGKDEKKEAKINDRKIL